MGIIWVDKLMEAMETEPSQRSASGAWGKLPLGLCLLLLAAIVVVRWIAPNLDFAMANIFTAGLSLLTWICGIWALRASGVPGIVWKMFLGVPVLVAAVFLAVFRLERVDGELRPHFQPRWQAAPDLPAAETDPSIAAADRIYLPAEGDFPQFLGPQRDATVRHVRLDPDWTTRPPEVLWKQPIGDGWSGFAIQGDLAITMEQRDSQEWVTAYSVLDGSLFWKYEIDALHTNMLGGTGPRSTPAIADHRVYVCSAVSHFACLELATGKKIWSQELLDLAGTDQAALEQSVAWGRAGSPLVYGQTVVIPLGGRSAETAQAMIAFHAETGEELWRAGDDQISYSSPMLAVLNGVEQVLLISESKLGAYLPDSGQELWSVPWPGHSNSDATVSQPIVFDTEHVLLTKGYGEGAKLLKISHQGDAWEPETVWKNATVLRTKFTNCVLREGYAYGLSDGILECVDLTNGKRQWKKGRYRQGQLLLVGDKLLISSERGEVVLVAADPDRFRELAKLPVIGDVTWNTLTLSKNRLLIRNSDEVACVQLPTLGETSSVESEHENSSSTPDGEPAGATL